MVSRSAVAAGAVPAILAGCGRKKPAFKFGACDWTLHASHRPKAFETAKSIGLDGVQVSAPFAPAKFSSPQNIAAFKAAMAATGLQCSGTAAMLNNTPFVSTDGAVEYTIGAVEAAAALGASDVLVPFYGKANMQGSDKRIREELFKPLVERLKAVAPVAEKLGVNLSLENSLCADDDIRIIEAVGSPAVKVYFDIFNFQYYGFETVPEMRKLKGLIGQIHLKDKGHRLDSASGCPRDMRACLDAILEVGYDGWLVFELHGHNPKRDGAMEDVLKHNLDFVKKYYA